MSENWNARRILNEIASAETRQTILEEFWRTADPQTKALATAHLAKAMRFREETIRKATAGKKAEWLSTRASAPELEHALEAALMAYHTKHARELMAAFLDQWNIPHEDGSIEAEDYEPPTEKSVTAAIESLRTTYSPEQMKLYLASAGLIMGAADPRWRAATWPAVEHLSG